MKKLSCLFISILFLLSVFSVSVSADTLTQISTEIIKAAPGSTIAVPVKISNNQGFWGMVLDIKFDTTALSVVEVRNNAEVFANGEITVGPSDYNHGYVRILTESNNLSKNNIKNGTLCTIILKVSESAAESNYSVILECADGNICDINLKDVGLELFHGSIDVNKNYEKPEIKDGDTYGDIIEKDEIYGEEIQDDNNFVYEEPETRTSVVYVTDKSGEVVTNKKGEKQTQIIIQTAATENLEKGESKTADAESGKSGENDDGNSMSSAEILLIIAAAVIIAIGITVVVLTVAKKKAKK